MKGYQIFCDSSSDMPDELLKQYNIKTIPFYVSFDGKDYLKEIQEISLKSFYENISSSKIFPKTSLPSVQDYINHFSTAINEGKDVLCLCLTDKFSGSWQAALNAREIITEEHPDAKIYIINTLQATGGEGITVLQSAKMQQAGYSIDKNYEVIMQIRKTSRIMFTIGTLEYLQKGGRIGKVASIAGSLLNLKPLIQLRDGELIPYGTIRGKNRSVAKVISMVSDYFSENNENMEDYDFGLISPPGFDDLERLKECLCKIDTRADYPKFDIGVTIGTYTGPDAMGVCFIKKYDRI